MKKHGTAGKIKLCAPATAVVNLMRVPTFEAAIEMLKRFPNFTVDTPKNVTVSDRFTISVKIKFWNKYQGDFSSDRVKKHRGNLSSTVTTNVTAQEEKRREVEEKRKEEIVHRGIPLAGVQKITSSSAFQRPTPEEVTAYAATLHFDLNGSRFCDYYGSVGWRVGRTPMKDWKAAVRTWKRKHDEENSHGTHDSKSPVSYAALARAKRDAQALRGQETPSRPLPDGLGGVSVDAPEAVASNGSGYGDTGQALQKL